DDSLRSFGRTDESYRPNYELIRQNKMPESESLLGRVLNRMLGPDDETVLRKQNIDGSKLPDFQVVRRYLGPTGMFMRSEKDGWYVAGVLLNKEDAYVEEAASTASTAELKIPTANAAESR
ncbi:MAG: hypothetical protein KDA92_12120, partial [Planctomycetales bacterium]|nr:hypothetical protein [Planctomycetales bacterium]